MSNIVYHDIEINGEDHSIPIDYDLLVEFIDFKQLSISVSSALYKFYISCIILNILCLFFLLLIFIFK